MRATLVLFLVAVVTFVVRGLPTIDTAAPISAAPSPSGLLIAGGSLQVGAANGVISTDLASQRELGHFAGGGPTQGDALARSPDGRHAYILDRIWHITQQRAEWQLVELELPSLKVQRRVSVADGINLLGRARVLAVAADGKEVYLGHYYWDPVFVPELSHERVCATPPPEPALGRAPFGAVLSMPETARID